jgi:hypothetical protein
MKAAIVTAAGKTPVYGDFPTPIARTHYRASIRIESPYKIASFGFALQFRRRLSPNRRVGRCWCNPGWEASLFRLA